MRAKHTARKSVYPKDRPFVSVAKKNIRTFTAGKKPLKSSPTIHRRKRRFRPGQNVLQQIRQFQGTTELLIPKAPFQRLVREIGTEITSDIRFYTSAVAALHQAAEDHLVRLYEDASLCATHAKRLTLFVKDLKLAQILRGDIV